MSAVINMHLRELHPFRGLIGVRDASLVVEYRQGERRATSLAGPELFIGTPTTYPVSSTGVTSVTLESSRGRFYARLSIYRGETLIMLRDVMIPDGGEHDLGDLPRVDPDTFEPLPVEVFTGTPTSA